MADAAIGDRTTRGIPTGLTAALLATLVARTVLPLAVHLIHREPRAFFTQDGLHYLELAGSIVTSGAYETSAGTELMRVPGFPALVTVGVWLGHPVLVTLVIHVLLGLLTTILCYAIARDLAGERAGTIAALLFACEPGQWVWSSLMLSETLFVSLVAGMLWFAVRYEQCGRLGHLGMAIVLASLSAYVRIVGYVLPFVLLLWFGVAHRRDRHVLAQVSAGLVLAMAVLGVWHVRNGIVSGYWGFSSQFDRAAYYAAGGGAEARRQGVPFGEARLRLEREIEASGAPAALQVAEMRSRGVQTVIDDPFAFAASYANGLFVTVVHPDAGTLDGLLAGTLLDVEAIPNASGASQFAQGRWQLAWRRLVDKGPVFWAFAIVQMALLAGASCLALRGFRDSGANVGMWVVVLPATCLLLLSGGPYGQGRFRAPLVPSLCILAGLGAVVLRRSPGPTDRGCAFNHGAALSDSPPASPAPRR